MAPVNNRVMQGDERIDRELLDAAALAGHLVPENSMFAFLAAHRAEVFPDADFADLFARRAGAAVDPGHGDGRGADPADPA